MSIINETNYKRILDILVGGLQYYPRTTTDYVWDPERKKTLKDVLNDISGGGGGSPGGPVSWSNIQNKPNTLFGFGILDAYTKSEVNSLILNIPTGASTWGDILNKPAWIGSSKPSYTAAEVGAISINAELFSGNYQDLANKPALGPLSSKSSIAISDIDATGSASSATFLAGDGVWRVPSGGGGSSIWGSISGNIAALTDLANALNNKVDKVTGKQLSSEDFTSAEKNKLATALTSETDPTVPSWAKQATKPSYTKGEVGLANVDNIQQATKSEFISHDSDSVRHITAAERNNWNASAGAGLSLGETSTTAYRGDRGAAAYNHSQEAHAPINAQKNSDITKAEIEAKLTGPIATHTHSTAQISDFPEKGNLVAGANITITESGNDITISSTGGGGGSSIHNDLTGRSTADAHPISAITGLQSITDSVANASTLVAGTNVTLTPSGSNIVISASGGGGGGSSVHNDLTGRELSNAHPISAITGLEAITDQVDNALPLIAGSNIILTPGGSGITISATGGGGGGSTYINVEEEVTVAGGDISGNMINITLTQTPVIAERFDVFLNGLLVPRSLLSITGTSLSIDLTTLNILPVIGDFLSIKYYR